jgi:hypothetical protein
MGNYGKKTPQARMKGGNDDVFEVDDIHGSKLPRRFLSILDR